MVTVFHLYLHLLHPVLCGFSRQLNALCFLLQEHMYLINWMDSSTRMSLDPLGRKLPTAVLIHVKQVYHFQSAFQPVLFILNANDPDLSEYTPAQQPDVSHAILKSVDFDGLVKVSIIFSSFVK